VLFRYLRNEFSVLLSTNLSGWLPLIYFNSDIFLEDLQNAPSHVMDVFDDVDDKLFAFEWLYLDIINEQTPILKEIPCERQSSAFHDGTVAQIHSTQKHCGKSSDTNYALYQKQRNKCTSLRRKATKANFLNKFETEKPNEFWNNYRPFL